MSKSERRRKLAFGKLFQRANFDTRSDLSTSGKVESFDSILSMTFEHGRQQTVRESGVNEGERSETSQIPPSRLAR